MTVEQISKPVFGDKDQIEAIKFASKCLEASELLDKAAGIIEKIIDNWQSLTPELQASLEYVADVSLLRSHMIDEKEEAYLTYRQELLDSATDARDWIKSLLDAKPEEAVDFITNNGEEIEANLSTDLALAKGETL